MVERLKARCKDGRLHRTANRWRDRREWARWDRAGRPQPTPQACKRILIHEVAERFGPRVFVETGTNFGHTVSSALGTFDTIYSIELDEALWQSAAKRFARHPEVRLRLGDSAVELAGILSELSQPALFWLDAHYSGAGTARGALDSPIMQELAAISRHQVSDHVLLIDDARMFDGTGGYPTLGVCRETAAAWWPAHDFEVADDVIRIIPRRPRSSHPH
jgi:hypothetical protein